MIASNRQRLPFVSGMRSVGTRSQRARKELEAAFESRRWQPKSGSGEQPARDNWRKDQAAACSVLMSFVRTLPIRVEPEDGEALDSWLETIARRTLYGIRGSPVRRTRTAAGDRVAGPHLRPFGAYSRSYRPTPPSIRCTADHRLDTDSADHLQLDRRGAELLFQVLTEREERSAIAIASNERFSSWTKTFTDPRLCASIVDRLTFAGQIMETGSTSYRLAQARNARPAS